MGRENEERGKGERREKSKVEGRLSLNGALTLTQRQSLVLGTPKLNKEQAMFEIGRHREGGGIGSSQSTCQSRNRPD